MWRVYQRGLERWLADLLQPVFDNLVAEVAVPRFVQRLRILEFTLDHEAPTFSRMRRRSSRKDSDLNGIVDVRYTGGARMLLLIEVGQGRWRFKVCTPQSHTVLCFHTLQWVLFSYCRVGKFCKTKQGQCTASFHPSGKCAYCHPHEGRVPCMVLDLSIDR